MYHIENDLLEFIAINHFQCDTFIFLHVAPKQRKVRIIVESIDPFQYVPFGQRILPKQWDMGGRSLNRWVFSKKPLNIFMNDLPKQRNVGGRSWNRWESTTSTTRKTLSDWSSMNKNMRAKTISRGARVNPKPGTRKVKPGARKVKPGTRQWKPGTRKLSIEPCDRRRVA